MCWHQSEESLLGFIHCVNIHAALSGNLVSISFTCILVTMSHSELVPSRGCQVIIKKLVRHEQVNRQNKKAI